MNVECAYGDEARRRRRRLREIRHRYRCPEC